MTEYPQGHRLWRLAFALFLAGFMGRTWPAAGIPSDGGASPVAETDTVSGPVPGVVARVGNRFISASVYAHELGRMIQALGITDLAALSPAEQKAIRLKVMDNLVNGLLLRLVAENRFQVSMAEVEHEMARGRRALGDGDRYLRWLQQHGLDESSLRDEIQGRIALTRLRQAIAEEITLSDAEVEAACEKARQDGRLQRKEETVDFQVIALAYPEDDPTAREKTEQLAREIKGRAEAGEDFSTLVRQWTNDIPAIERDGWSWETPLASLPEPVAQVIRNMPEGSISEPVALPGAFQLIRLDKRHAPGIISCEEATPAILYHLKQRKINEKLSETAKSAALTMRVELFPAVADTIAPDPDSRNNK